MKPPDAGGESHFYLAYNRTKRSVALDIRTREGQEIIHRLAALSDVLIENFRTGVMERFGLDWASVRERHPHLIYCSISAYGRQGPLADRPGFDPVLQAESGMMAMTGEPGADPLRHPLAIIDTFTALYATSAILAAVLARRETGRGQLIELALIDCGVAVTGNAASYYLTSGTDPARLGNAHPAAVPTGLFKTKTAPFYLACGTDRLFHQLCRVVLGRADLAEDPRFALNTARVANRDELFRVLGEIFAADTCESWLARLRQAGLPAGAVRRISETLESEDVADLLVTVDHPTAGALRIVGSPYRFSDTPTVPASPPPLLGQHTDEVLAALLDLSAADLARLRAAHVIR